MGDRVLIQVTDRDGRVSPVLYLHWGGEEAPEIIREAAALMAGRDGDLGYAFGRLVGVAHSRTPGRNTGLGVWNQPTKLEASDSHGDAGCYVVSCETWEVEAFGGYGTPFNARSKQDAA